MVALPTASIASGNATLTLAPRQIANRSTTVANKAIRTPQKSTTAFKPLQRNKIANVTSDSHSQANQGAPGFENENKSVAGTWPVLRMYSPARMCQPVSPSIRRAFQPLAPARNSQTRMAR